MEASPVAICSACGGTSRDLACCEFCNANLTPGAPIAPTTCPIAPEGPFFLSAQQAGLLTRPEASVTLFTPEKSWRLHWIACDLWPEWRPRVEERLARSSQMGLSALTQPGAPLTQTGAPLPPCRIVEDLTGVWVVADAGGRRPEPWRIPASEDPADRLRLLAGGRGTAFWDVNPAERLGQMVTFLERLADTMDSLHAAGLVWLPFHPFWIEESDAGLRPTNMDLAVNPFASLGLSARVGQEESERDGEGERMPGVSQRESTIRLPNPATPDSGLLSPVSPLPPRPLAPSLSSSLGRPRTVPAFTAPEVARGPVLEIGPRTDVYHLALLTYYWLSRYLPHGFPGKGLASFEFVLPPLRILAPTLPVGIAGVVTSGLAVEPWRRPASPRAFCGELRAAIDSIGVRQAASSPLSWEIGAHTRTGKAKASRGGVNQDSILVRRFDNPERALLVVADGLSCCDVGSGDVASLLVCEAIDASIHPDSHAEDFVTHIPQACRRGAEAILAWALDRGERLRLIAAQDLMATTVLAAWLEGDTVIVANAGDSRAYLLNDHGIEQVTVDADLGCTLLAAGSPPENVVELGAVTRALRSCVGGVLYKSATEELVIDDTRFKLAVSRWKLLPNETLVLCSDGLVEEGAFLEPAELLDLVCRHAELPVQDLAVALADAAEARQIVPCEEEPDGLGDNISCCVIRIRE